LDIELMGRMRFDHIPEAKRPASHGMLMLCESWIDADGDQIALNMSERVEDECPIYYYGHDSRHPGRVKRIAGRFDELLSWWEKGERACSAALKR
jgi:hypothetical protein